MKQLAILLFVGLILTLGCSNDSDDSSPTGVANNPPTIRSLSAYPSEIARSGEVEITAIVTDNDGDSLSYYWACMTGEFSDRTGSIACWVASVETGTHYISLTVSDGKSIDSDSVAVSVTAVPNTPPTKPYDPSPHHDQRSVPLSTDLTWGCDDADGDTLEYDVYFGTDLALQSLIFVRRNLTDKRTNATDLRSGMKYYWRVVVRDNHGAEVIGRVWDFYTQ